MPTYTYKNINTQEIEEHFMKMSEKDEFERAHLYLERHLEAANTITGYHKKPDAGFRDLLKTIKKGNSRGFSESTVNTF